MEEALTVTDTTGTFPDLPPFPDDVPTAPLLRLSLKRLLDGEIAESQRFFDACKDIGFFYLDLRGTEVGDSLLDDADRLFEVGKKFFELPVEEKTKYDFSRQNSYFGYKGYGANVVDKDGSVDRNEFYNVSRSDIYDLVDPISAPAVMTANRPLLRSYISSAHSLVLFFLDLLNDRLHYPPGTLANLHRLDAISGDQVRFIKAPPQPIDDRKKIALGEHTDFGSITVLFNRLGGLQILPPGKDSQWCYVKPLPGHAIVNLGDAMVKFTNGLLRSNIHRVIASPGLQADTTRYSLVYFSRPEDDVVMKRLEGSDLVPPLADGQEEEEINSKDWIIRRALGKRIWVPKEEWSKAEGTENMSRRAYL